MTWNKENIQNLIRTNDRALIKALLKIYENQTEEEKNAEETLYHNGVGFTGVDAKILSSFAEFYLKNGFLTKKQMIITRNKMVKYHKQILILIEQKQNDRGEQ